MGESTGISQVELVDPEEVLLREIADFKFRQRDVSVTYAFGLRQGGVDWAKVNRAIIRRWSVAGLERIKGHAWKLYHRAGTANARTSIGKGR